MSNALEERFWAKVNEGAAEGCWTWTACIVDGYGQFSVPGRRRVKAHRFAYELLVGPIPAGLQLDHLCRNRACVNPAHLEVVTNAENTQRGAWATLTPEAVRAIRAAPPTVTTRALARQWGVGRYAVAYARKGITWSNVG